MSGTTIIALWVWWILLFFPLRAANKQLLAMGKSLNLLETVLLYLTLTLAIPRYYYLWVRELVSGNRK